MAHIRERIFVKCPLASAGSYLERAIPGLSREQGGHPTLALEAPLREAGLPGNITIGSDVVASFRPRTDPDHLTEPYDVHWEPKGSGLFPTFNGRLIVAGSEDYESCRLILDGSYDPPLGSVGKAFDAAVGRRIARATARALLDAVGARMEAAFREDEAAKGGPA